MAALDALAELGKAVQNKEQPSESWPARLQSEFKPNNNRYSRRRGTSTKTTFKRTKNTFA